MSASVACLIYPVLVALPAASLAHHSGLYDDQNVVTLEGTIESIAWINPHVRVTLATVAENGEPELWEIEGTSVNALSRWGIERDLFRVGDRLRVRGPVSRFGRKAMIGATADLPDGERVVLWPNVASKLGLAETGVAGLFPPPAGAPATAPVKGIFRVWTPRGRSPALGLDALPLSAGARDAALLYDPITDDPALRCEPPGMPAMLETPYPIEFVDEGERILMRFEEWDGVRTVYLRPGGGPPVQEPSPKGVSFGRWEGRTLAVFTLYIDYPYFDDLGTPQSKDVTVLERYTPSADETRLDFEVTVTDPATFNEPVVRRGYFAYEPGEAIKPYNCTLLEP